jgi:hypothetical protein
VGICGCVAVVDVARLYSNPAIVSESNCPANGATVSLENE